jgi:transaldolase
MTSGNMRIFLDTADTDIIREHFATGMIDGVTTNPTLIRKSGRKPEDVYQEIQDIGLRDISMEVVGDANEMIEEGIRLATKFPNSSTIKVPCTRDGLTACRALSRDLIRVNVTLIFDVAQAILAAKAGAAYVSPFVGRLDDNSIAGLNLIKDIDQVYKVQAIHRTRILSASIRYVNSVSQSFANGADIVTMPPSVFEKMYNHVLTDKGLEIFDNDWKEVEPLLAKQETPHQE